ncbi:hypothetical protein NC653_031977 [Populus alba x Populus x berolinensis]|uniref:Uncharacterized protein n=1 Tax=Populus alba x Populus x berolinensis TaxID=444605 RepID=A0AAD6Q444_9ROSI|nr:hypothetical protein NC653_031977 [Populus alba x Populus x berolinensis]
MTCISYARVLIEIDLLSELPSSINVLLPNGTLLVQHLVYESKRPHATSASAGPSAETDAVEKQSPYCAGPSCNFREDPMSSEAAAMDSQPSSSQPPDCKRSKADMSALVAPGQKPNTYKIPRRQYLTQSKAVASSCGGSTFASF